MTWLIHLVRKPQTRPLTSYFIDKSWNRIYILHYTHALLGTPKTRVECTIPWWRCVFSTHHSYVRSRSYVHASMTWLSDMKNNWIPWSRVAPATYLPPVESAAIILQHILVRLNFQKTLQKRPRTYRDRHRERCRNRDGADRDRGKKSVMYTGKHRIITAPEGDRMYNNVYRHKHTHSLLSLTHTQTHTHTPTRAHQLCFIFAF